MLYNLIVLTKMAYYSIRQHLRCIKSTKFKLYTQSLGNPSKICKGFPRTFCSPWKSVGNFEEIPKTCDFKLKSDHIHTPSESPRKKSLRNLLEENIGQNILGNPSEILNLFKGISDKHIFLETPSEIPWKSLRS